jgi:hypothetical protein
MDNIRINEHVFHGFYSNFGYKPDLTRDKLWADYPIHFKRAFVGATDPYKSNDFIPKEFETEEEAFKWYKKNKYSQSDFDSLKFPNDFCKNYFTFPESDFFKYRNLFHGMIKGIKVNSDIEISTEGTVFSPECPQCKKDIRENAEVGNTAGPITFNSPDGQPSYFVVDGFADDIGYLNGVKITDGDIAGFFNQNLIPKTPQSTLSFTAVDTQEINVGIQATVTWYKKIEYTQKFKININFDSTKIFEISEIQKRLSPNDMEYKTSIGIENTTEYHENLSIINRKIFEKNWEFNENEFKSIFENKEFNANATYLNDPVLIENPLSLNNFRKLGLSILNSFSSSNINNQTISEQKNLNKKFQKFGSIEYQIINNNSIIESSSNNLNFYIEEVIYIKSKKIYLCFVEVDNTINLRGQILDKEKDCDTECEDLSPSPPNSLSILKSEDLIKILLGQGFQKLETSNEVPIGITNPYYFDYVLTTEDTFKSYGIYSTKYQTSDCDQEGKSFEFDKTTCDFKIGGNIFQFEINKLKNDEFIYDNSNCEDSAPFATPTLKKKISINLIKKPTFEIIEWKKTDFFNKNTYPSKVS